MGEWIRGRNPVYEVLRARRRRVYRLLLSRAVAEKGRITDVLRLCAERGVPVERASRGELDALGPGHQGVAVEVGDYPYCALADVLAGAAEDGQPALILILDALQDPQNLGTLIRTAEVVGVHGVLIPKRRTATVTPAVVQSSSGASEHVRIAQVNLAQTIASLKEAGVWVVGLETSPKAKPLEQVPLDLPLALVVGGEGQGMRRLVRDSCDILLRLPMRGRTGSLNAAVAGSVALYFVWQARGF